MAGLSDVDNSEGPSSSGDPNLGGMRGPDSGQDGRVRSKGSVERRTLILDLDD